MPLFFYQTIGWLAVLAAMCVAGCRREPSKANFEAAQQRTQGQTAQESSRDRLDPGGETRPDVTSKSIATEELGPPPAFNPDGESTAGQIDWTASGIEEKRQIEDVIDIESLKSSEPVAGSQLNRYFPAQQAGEDRVAKQEKNGFAQYSFRREGVEVAQLSITDLRSNPAAAEKFRETEMRIDGYPSVPDGSKGTTLLVAGRFQVKVRSPGGQLNEADRIALLKKFDLAALQQFGQ